MRAARVRAEQFRVAGDLDQGGQSKRQEGPGPRSRTIRSIPSPNLHKCPCSMKAELREAQIAWQGVGQADWVGQPLRKCLDAMVGAKPDACQARSHGGSQGLPWSCGLR